MSVTRSGYWSAFSSARCRLRLALLSRMHRRQLGRSSRLAPMPTCSIKTRRILKGWQCLWPPPRYAACPASSSSASLTGNQWARGPHTAHITNCFNELAIHGLSTHKECAQILCPISLKIRAFG